MALGAASGHLRRWPWIAGAVVVLLVGGIAIARSTLYRDRSRVVSTDEAVDAYRRDASTTTTASAPSAVSMPSSSRPSAPLSTTTTAPSVPVAPLAAGVYRYRTTGDESVDVLGGAHHTYPATTTVTVTPDGCGLRLRWDTLRERRDEWRLCPSPAGLTMPWGLSYHEFFKQPDPEELVCPAGTLLLPAADEPGQTWQAACLLAGDPEPQAFEVVGPEELTVEGRPVPTMHVRETVELGGEYYEHAVTDWWLTADGLPVRWTEDKRSRSASPIGGVTYVEHYTNDLDSLTPLR